MFFLFLGVASVCTFAAEEVPAVSADIPVMKMIEENSTGNPEALRSSGEANSAHPAQDRAGLKLFGIYAQSENFWKTVHLLEENPDYISVVNRYFANPRLQAQEAWSSVEFALSSEEINPLKDHFQSASFALGLEALAGGQMRNRISPKIEAYQLYHAFLNFRIENGSWLGNNPYQERYYSEGFGLLLGSRVGLGRQTLLAGEVSSFLDTTREKKHYIYEGSFQAGLSYSAFIHERLRSYSTARIDPAFFHATQVETTFGDAVRPRTDTYRWRLESENMFHFSKRGGLALGTQIFSGPQPLPFDLLPKIWDPVHEKLINFDFKAQYLGLGAVIEVSSESRRYAGRLVGGYYGGYWGTGAEINLAFFKIQAGTFGLEMSPKFRSFENRIYFAKGGLHFDW